mmetsp:Transcript_7865/g.22048  ORF Transcript_7865/g.22048 Transcript_7865/m.22048 type:complete len:392 (+) Transcript_7865:165-1340(+)
MLNTSLLCLICRDSRARLPQQERGLVIHNNFQNPSAAAGVSSRGTLYLILFRLPSRDLVGPPSRAPTAGPLSKALASTALGRAASQANGLGLVTRGFGTNALGLSPSRCLHAGPLSRGWDSALFGLSWRDVSETASGLRAWDSTLFGHSWSAASEPVSLLSWRGTSSSICITLCKMYLRHAGKMTTQTMMPRAIWTNRRCLCAALSDMAITPPSKQCSQENPTRMLSAVTLILTIWAPRAADSCPPRVLADPSFIRSCTVSMTKIAPQTKAFSAPATTTVLRRWWSVTPLAWQSHSMAQSVATSTHQAKDMAVALRIVLHVRKMVAFARGSGHFSLYMAIAWQEAIATVRKPIPYSGRTCLCSSGLQSSGSFACSSGRWSVRPKRRMFTAR